MPRTRAVNWLALAVFMASPGADAQAPARPAVPQNARAPSNLSAAAIPAIDSFVRRAFAIGAVPGLGVAVVDHGRIVYLANLGFADVDAGIPANDSTLWYVASTSKSFTGFGIALLEAAGEVDLTAPITTLLPRVHWHPDARPSELTLAAFLSHTHGLGDGPIDISAAYTGAVGEDRFGDLLAFSAPRPTRQLEYSNVGYYVAGMVISARRPEGWKRFLEREVFRRAGLMDIHDSVSTLPTARVAKSHRLQADGRFDTEPFVKRDATMHAAGGHLATIRDLARWTILHLDDGMLNGQQVFPASVVRRSHEILGRQPPNVRFVYFERAGWGMGWDVGSYGGEPMISRFGAYDGFRSHLSMLPARGVGVVVETNGRLGHALNGTIAAYVYDLVLGKESAEARGRARLDSLAARLPGLRQRAAKTEAEAAAREQPLPHPLSDYTGTYDDAALGQVVITAVNERLWIHWGVLDAPLRVADAQKNQLHADLLGGDTVVQFQFTGAGGARAVEIDGRALKALGPRR